MFTLVSDVQFIKANDPTSVIVLGMVIDLIRAYSNARLPIDETV